MIYLIYDKNTCRIVSHTKGTTPPSVLDHHAYITVDEVPVYSKFKVVNGQLVEVTRVLEKEKIAKCKKITIIRDTFLYAGCDTPFGKLDSDEVSRSNILGGVSLATIAKASGAPFSITWRRQDNTYVDLDADQMIEVGVTVGLYISAVYSKSFALKDAVEAVTTVEAVDDIVIDQETWFP